MNEYLKIAKENIGTIKYWAEHIYKNPFTGFKEFDTASFIANEIGKMGLEAVLGSDIPFVKAVLDTKKPGPVIAVLGEMDSIILDSQPSHACGHNIGCAAMLGALMLLRDTKDLCGKIVFMAVPAEEHIETSYRIELEKKGIIKYPSGKPELLHRGLFDNVDMCIMVHMMPQDNEISMMTTANGNIIKEITFYGKAAHAGNAPHEGINALYAANLSLNAINALRETFTEDQYARVHPIITKGGDVVNVIPSQVKMESYIRASSVKYMKDINDKVNRAIKGCAYALSTDVTIEDVPGYMPIYTHPDFNQLSISVAEQIFKGPINTFGHLGLCSDIGDMSCLMPIMHPFVGGVSGTLHGNDFKVSNEETAYAKSAAFLALLAEELLKNCGKKALEIKKAYRPLYKDFKSYFNDIDSMYKKETSL